MFENIVRKATPEEIHFYEKIFYPLQDDIFSLIQTDRLYLSGGTCLSRFYYNHRYSEDLDFFFDGFQYPKEEFGVIITEIVNRISEKYKTEITVSGEFFRRGFVYKDDIALKIEFIYENFRNIGKRNKVNGIYIDSKENIATNKLTAIYDRKTAKDFFDLYYLLQDLDIEDIVQWAKYKVVPLDYEGTLLAFAEPKLEGIILTKKDVSLRALDDFAGKLIKRIIENAKR